MRMVKISKVKLLDKLKENRKDHRVIFEEALEGWKARVIGVLDCACREAREGRKYKTHFNLPIPNDHTADYDEIIERVEWHEEEFIELDVIEFNRYVRDNWDWMPDFIGLASSYSSSSSSSSSSALSKKISAVKGFKSGEFIDE